MRSYHVAAASFAIGCDAKWLDNLITQCSPDGITRAQRGVARRVSAEAVLTIAVARAIALDLGLPLARALGLARELVAGAGRLTCPGGTSLSFDVDGMRGAIAQRLEDAAEVLVAPRRGRPPTTARR